MTLLGNTLFADIIKMRSYWNGWDIIPYGWCPYEEKYTNRESAKGGSGEWHSHTPRKANASQHRS